MTEPEDDFIQTLEDMLAVAAQNAADNVCTDKITDAVQREMKDQMPGAIKQGICEFAKMIGMDISNTNGVIMWQQRMSFLGMLHSAWSKFGLLAGAVIGAGIIGYWVMP